MAFLEKSNRAPNLGPELKIWTERHALWVGLALLGVVSDLPLAVFPIMAALSFSRLILEFRTRWTPMGRFGLANAITLVRLLGVFFLCSIPVRYSGWTALFALSLLAMDALDGWIARSWHLSSEFGEFFDKEVDAFFLLALCVLLSIDRRLGLWILIPGLLRYLFVAVLRFCKPLQIKEHRSRLGCLSYVLMMLSLISSFIVTEPVYTSLLVLMTCVLCVSFADSMRRMQWKKDPTRELE